MILKFKIFYLNSKKWLKTYILSKNFEWYHLWKPPKFNNEKEKFVLQLSSVRMIIWWCRHWLGIQRSSLGSTIPICLGVNPRGVCHQGWGHWGGDRPSGSSRSTNCGVIFSGSIKRCCCFVGSGTKTGKICCQFEFS